MKCIWRYALQSLFIPIAVFQFGFSQEWTLIPSGVTNSLNGVDFYDDMHGIIVGDTGLILRTVDGGLSWDVMLSGVNNDLNDVSYFEENMVMAVGNQSTSIRSADGGQSWEWIGIPGWWSWDYYAVSVHPDGNGLIGGAAQTILETTDHGLTWSLEQTDMLGGGFWGAQMVTNELGFVFGQNSINQPLIMRTQNGGTSYVGVAFYFFDGGIGNEGRLTDGHFLSANTGFTSGRRWDGLGCISRTDNLTVWETYHYSDVFQGVEFISEMEGIVVGESGRIKWTHDYGDTYTDEDSGTTENLYDVSAAGDLTWVAVGDNGTILRYSSQPPGEPGDVNSDLNIDILDIVRIVNIIIGNPPEPTFYELWASDINEDGLVNILDIISLINIIVS